MIKVTFNCAKHHIDELEETLQEMGAVSIVITPADEQEIFEPELNTQPLWENCLLSAFFTDVEQQNFLQTECQILAEDLNIPFELSIEHEQDWSKTWQQDFHTMQFGNRLIIHPSHETPEKIDQYAILLDPGLAFGTGKHPTTALCLAWLDANVKVGDSVLDYGCGSGILAIAAAKLGANPVIAVDIDPQALNATQDNCIKNNISNVQILPAAQTPNEPVDILIANILANPLIALAEQLASRVKANGKIALSGILTSQAHSVLEAYRPYFDIELTAEQEDWVLLSGSRLD